MTALTREQALEALHGLYCIAVTPFEAGGALDRQAFAAVLERAIAANYDGILVGGTYGEFAAMTVAERADLFRHAAAVVHGRVPLMLCAASADVRVVEELGALAVSLGGMPMVTPPYVSEVTPDHIEAFFRRIAAAVAPLVIYNAPGVGITLAPALIERLAEISGIVGLKQGDLAPLMVDELAGRVGGRLRLFCASDLQMPAALAAGFDGLSSTNSCALPELIHESFHAFTRGDGRRGAMLYGSWYDYRMAVRRLGQPQSVKAAMRLRGWIGGHVRAPLHDLTKQQEAELAAVFMPLVAASGDRQPIDRAA
jgi:dihydrodipicolinate synthase/N-acetylneuraminate lyase